ncbi:HPP family protein [Coprinopsis cinerea AmutBmut pab1-1]|nr:HPP family protein [Coprinopsis cinerea AmutBmut pab1-1]
MESKSGIIAPANHPTAPRTRNLLGRLPKSISRWLGYRPTAPPPSPNYVIWIWSFIGAFCGLSIVQALFSRTPHFIEKGVPPIIASYGASAVLIYGVLDGPLAQPRALVGGHFVGALIGTCISKLFGLLSEEKFEEVRWVAASLACATAIVAMQMTATTHPPAGATAFLPLLDPSIRAMSWYYLPVILLTSLVCLAVALLLNNIQRRYPVFWVAPVVMPPPPPQPNTVGDTTPNSYDGAPGSAEIRRPPIAWGTSATPTLTSTLDVNNMQKDRSPSRDRPSESAVSLAMA